MLEQLEDEGRPRQKPKMEVLLVKSPQVPGRLVAGRLGLGRGCWQDSAAGCCEALAPHPHQPPAACAPIPPQFDALIAAEKEETEREAAAKAAAAAAAAVKADSDKAAKAAGGSEEQAKGEEGMEVAEEAKEAKEEAAKEEAAEPATA